ncbi:LuxR C-terminal-related transcriptional regulator [Sinomonas sp. P47F7]|uniref:LuxR C-terminal-related transcriptional regulator n=1 Tax=Sinomonas sp. P47F7 TaxID=3410987 RepID=UPI003BF5FB15
MVKPHEAVVARAQDLSEVETLLGAGGRVVIEGPPGIGKTALALAYAEHHPELAFLSATATPWEHGLEGGLLAQLGITPAPEEGAEAHEDSWGRPEGEPDWLPAGRAALTVLRGLAAENPALLLLDGIDHADALSLEALAFALRRLGPAISVIATMGTAGARTGGVAAGFAEAVDAPRLRLGPLTLEGLKDLAKVRLGADLAPEALQALWDASRGNPSLALEALQNGVESFGAARVAAEGPPPVLPSLAQRTARTLASLPNPARALVQAVSVLGTPSASEARTLAGLPDDPDAVLHAVDAAWAAGLLECHTVAGGLRLTMADPLVAAAVHESLGPLLAASLHRRAAEMVETTRERIRHLVAAAPMPDRELAAAVDGLAEAEAADGDWNAAADALVAAARLHADPAQREDRLLRAAEAMVGAGDLARAAPLARQIESLPQSPERDAALAYHAIHTGQARRAGVLLARAWETRPPDAPADLSARIAQYRVLDALGSWDAPAMLSWTEATVRFAGPDSPEGIESRAMLGLALGSMGRRQEAWQAYDDLAASPHLGGRDQRLHLGRGWLALALDDLDTARLDLRAAIPPARRPGALRITLWAHAWLARAEFAVGRWDEALATARAGLALNAPVGVELIAPLLHLTAAQVHALRGQTAAAAEHSRIAQTGPETYPVMRLARAMTAASMAESAGDYGAVLRALEPIAQLDRSHGLDEPGFWPWQDVYANALVMAGRLEAADAFLSPLEEAARLRGHRSTMARLGYVRGRLLGAQGRPDEAVRVFDDALAAIDGMALPWGAARVRFAYGQTLRRAGRRRDATEVLAAARDAFSALGTSVYVARCERELQAAGTAAFRSGAVSAREHDGALRHPPSPSTPAFTAQEDAVARLVATGLSNRDAARELFVSVKTVQYHLTRIYAKLGIGSRSELAALYGSREAHEEDQAADAGDQSSQRPFRD